jgi:hypothetical protein
MNFAVCHHLLQPKEKKTQDDDELGGLSSSFLTQEKNP